VAVRVISGSRTKERGLTGERVPGRLTTRITRERQNPGQDRDCGSRLQLYGPQVDQGDTHIKPVPFLHIAQMQGDLIQVHALLEDDDIRVLDELACSRERCEAHLSILSGGGWGG